MKVKDAGSVAAKYVARAQGATQAYTDGINNPKNPWAATTAAADKNWSAGVQTAVSDGRFVKGVNKAGDQKWKNGAVNKGSTRYGQGVSQAQGTYQAAIGPVLSVIGNVQLPARFPKGDPQNNARTQAVNQALRAYRLGTK
jgi:hypothetical protein